jgi:hypothetical protein
MTLFHWPVLRFWQTSARVIIKQMTLQLHTTKSQRRHLPNTRTNDTESPSTNTGGRSRRLRRPPLLLLPISMIRQSSSTWNAKVFFCLAISDSDNLINSCVSYWISVTGNSLSCFHTTHYLSHLMGGSRAVVCFLGFVGTARDTFLESSSLLLAGGLLEAWLGFGSLAGPFVFTLKMSARESSPNLDLCVDSNPWGCPRCTSR